MATGYPVGLTVDYPERKLNRLTTFFRIFVAVPIIIVLGLLMGGSYNSGAKEGGAFVAGVGMIFLPLVLMLLFRLSLIHI